MAVRDLTYNRVGRGGRVASTAVGALLNGDQSAALEVLDCLPEKTVQVTGTFGAGGSVSVEKNVDGATWVALAAADVKSGTHPVTAAGLLEIVTAARQLRLNVTAGDGTTALTGSIGLTPAAVTG